MKKMRFGEKQIATTLQKADRMQKRSSPGRHFILARPPPAAARRLAPRQAAYATRFRTGGRNITEEPDTARVAPTVHAGVLEQGYGQDKEPEWIARIRDGGWLRSLQ